MTNKIKAQVYMAAADRIDNINTPYMCWAVEDAMYGSYFMANRMLRMDYTKHIGPWDLDECFLLVGMTTEKRRRTLRKLANIMADLG